ncbi:MAG TPA: thiamine pyrophosphate-dependent enzyme [Acidimicrobiales bacterium]|nr:thiamine pyrophosphate-dependent enzyme [Acidimicrobiales bacterium]
MRRAGGAGAGAGGGSRPGGRRPGSGGSDEGGVPPLSTVADATSAVWDRLGLTTLFANPGSTEIPLLCRPDERIRFVLGLHEGSVVGAATGYALATDRPALVLLHTTAGFGNAVGAIATARVNRAPLVVVVGQQDRRHLASRPFLAGDLDGLAGSYPVWAAQPARAQDVPGTMERAWHEARTRRGPAVVVVPMDDWDAESDPDGAASARTEISAVAADPHSLAPLVEAIDGAGSPVVVVGADADGAANWAATVALAERLAAPVWQEPFGARAGFPQDHRLFAGHLPAGRERLRHTLAGHDLVLVIGAPAFRQYPYEPGPLVAEGTRVAMVVDDAELAHHSPAELAVIGPIAGICGALAGAVKGRAHGSPAPASSVSPASPVPLASSVSPAAPASWPGPEPSDRPGRGGGGLRPRQLFAALAARVPADTIVVEESPSSRPDLHRFLPARHPLGFVSAAMGGLGFGLPAAVGLRMGCPDRPVIALVGDGSSLYGIQALWTAARYRVGALFMVLANGRYAVMDRLAERAGHPGPWPPFPEISVATLAEGLGCPARRVGTEAELSAVLDETLPDLRAADSPLVVEVDVADEAYFAP